jgi:spermidine synthase
VLGSFCAGFVLVPFLGKEAGLRWVCGLQLFFALVFVVRLLRARKASWGLAVASIAAFAGLGAVFFYPNWDRHSLSSGKYHRFDEFEPELITATWGDAFFDGSEVLARYRCGELIHYGDGVGGFTTVVQHPAAFGNAEFAMSNSGKPDASSRGDMETYTLLAHVPLLFSRDAKSVLVIGLASGITAGEVLHYPIDNLDVVEISREVIAASKYFVPWNNDVLQNPKTQVFVQDARAHVLLTRRHYDVVISEPSNPWMAGLAALFTHEFFATVKERLNQGGVFCQWLHAYQMDWPTFALVGRTFSEVFDHGVLFVCRPSTEGKDFLLVGFNGGDGLSFETATENVSSLSKSKNIDLSNPQLLRHLVVAENLRELFGPGPTNTDEWPRLEFEAPKLMYHRGDDIRAALKERRRLKPATEAAALEIARDVDRQIEFAAFALSVHEPFVGMVDLSRADPQQKERYFKLWESYSGRNAIRYSLLDPELAGRCTDVQLQALTKTVQSSSGSAVSYAYLGTLQQRKGDLDGAIESFNRSLVLGADVEVHSKLAFALLRRSKIDDAIRHYEEALQLRPFHKKALANLGRAWLQQGEFEKAVDSLQEALRWEPGLADAHSNLGAAYAQMKYYGKAIPHFEEALRLKPELWRVRRNLELAQQRLAEEGVAP